ncbi:hypothetical protein DY000_02030816 [Brassica cretica]|uniref:Transmembrane protein n=1 Tax=Brassica cretica TaxID=69181 RepID=A0ABQ7DYG9_BRACR|nr:hypothetical protein DY000_02030816 [Brassica cretica]
MRGKSDPALGSSSIGGKVRLKNRVGVEPRESMDSSDLSLDLTSEIERLSRAAVESATPTAEAGRLPLVGPLSVIGVEEVAGWREKYEISDDVDIRVLGPIDRVSDFDVPEGSDSHAEPERYRSHRGPIFLFNFSFEWGEKEGTINATESSLFRKFRRTRGNATQSLMVVGPKNSLSCVFRGFPCLALSWWAIGVVTTVFSSIILMISICFCRHSLRGSFFGKEDDGAVVKLPSERSQVPFLVSREALELCSIWGKFLPYLLFLVNSLEPH